MALTIVGPIAVRGTASRGVPSAELGVICHKFLTRYFPEVDTRFQNIAGQAIVRSIAQSMSREISVEGIISGTTGLMAFTVGVALGFANNITYFAPTGGTILLDEAIVNVEQAGWRRVAIKASSDPLI